VTPGQVLAVIGALSVALLLSETLLDALRLSRLRLGSFGWTVGIAALAIGAFWADCNTAWDPQYIHYAALGAGTLLTCLWFNDHRLVRGRSQSSAAASTN
jgi:hypothetical protein